MELSDRIKCVREASGLNQTEFGKRIEIGSSGMSKLEKGINNPADRTIRLICSEFGINRHWLETGEGEMRDPQRTSDIELLAQAATGQCEAKKIILRAVASMPDDLLVKILEYLNEAQKKSQA